ncbi:MAG: Ig-like domain-containing protein [Anaerolineae bacterium]|nr:Ig-like domain-containing protein [Anaerolineae bacterium]
MKRQSWFAVLLIMSIIFSGMGLVQGQPGGANTAPRVISTTPAQREVVGPDVALQIVFDQAMDRTSVEASLVINPQVQGAITWKDDTTLLFDPAGALDRGVEYTLTVEASAMSAAGVALEDRFRLNFRIAPNLSVSQAIPAPGAESVEAGATVTVVFDRPVVPLVTTGDQGSLPQPLSFSPAVEGKGEWLGTSIYTFRPTKAFVGGTLYTATISGDLKDVDGSPMSGPYTWQFRTVAPMILNFYPYDSSTAPLNQAIQIDFNQPMDKESVRANFTLRNLTSSADVAGTFTFSNDDRTLIFQPTAPLAMATRYQAAIRGGARSASGEAVLTNPQSRTFSTYPYPSVTETSPRNGEKVYPGSGAVIYFSTPMDEKSFVDKVKVEPKPENLSLYPSYTSLSIQFRSLPATTYTITLEAGVKDIYGNEIKEPYTFSFSVENYRPSLRITPRSGLNLTSAYRENTSIVATMVNIQTIELKIAKLSVEELLRMSDDYGGINLYNYIPPRFDRIWTMPVEAAANEVKALRLDLAEGGGALTPGIYYIEAWSPQFARFLQSPIQEPIRQVYVVATSNVVTKLDADGNVLAWVTDLKSGKPVANAAVSFYRAGEGRNAPVSVDGNGLARAKLSTNLNDYRSYGYWTIVEGEGVFSLGSVRWSESLEPYQFEIGMDTDPVRANIYLYSDQPFYRPGRPVYYRGIVRGQDDVTFAVPAGEQVQVIIYDANGQEASKERLTLNQYGAFSGKFDLKPQGEAPLGNYSLYVEWRGEGQYLNFNVAEFRPPEFLVTTTADKPEYVAGDTIKVTIDAKFLFGGSVSGASVNWAAYANSTGFNYRGLGGFEFVDYYGSGWVYNRQVANGSGTLDEKGQLVIEVPADLAGGISLQEFTVEATVTDVSNQTISGRTSVTVHPAEVYVGLQPKKYVGEAGQPFEVAITTVDWHSAPVPNRKAQVKVTEMRWVQDPKTFDWKRESIPVTSEEMSTDAEGKAVFTFTPAKSGVYEVKVTARDDRERIAQSKISVWVRGADPIAQMDTDKKLNLIADRKGAYQPGETAEILIPSPFSGKVLALVTVERARIMHTEIIEIEGAYTYKLPITDTHAPNVYLSVTLFNGSANTPEGKGVPELRYGLINLTVAVTKQLNIKLTPSVERAAPGETVTFDVLITDQNDEPVAAEVGLSLSDVATLSVGAPNSGPIFTAYWSTRGLSILTATALNRLIDGIKLQEELDDLARDEEGRTRAMSSPAPSATMAGMLAGGEAAPGAPAMEKSADGLADSGGGGGAQVNLTPRTDFVDTPLWSASLITGVDGRTQASVKLPDNLTTWRLDARAISLETAAGDATLEIMSTKPLLVRPATPRFFVVGDEVELAMVVNNNTSSELNVVVKLDAKGVTLRAAADQTVTIPADGRIRVLWLATVENVEFVDLTFSALSGEFGDASKPAVGLGDDRLLPVYKYEAPDYVSTAGSLRQPGERVEGLLLPPTELAPSGELTIKINPSLAATTLDGLEYLRNYPYQCLEQTVSRFLPNVITYRALQKAGVDDPKLRAQLDEAVAYALKRLQQEQHPDGGWGWYVREESSILTTAYALLGLLEARDADFSVPNDMIDRAQGFLLSRFPAFSDQTPAYELNRWAFVSYVLSRAGSPNLIVMESLFIRREKMSLDGRAFLALAHQPFQNQAEGSRITTLLSDLQSAAIASATGIHWEEDRRDWWNWGSNTRTTALILETLVKFDPQSELIPNVVRWLMVARRGDAWETTQETAWSVMALTDWMVVSGELKANYEFAVSLNGNKVGEGKATKETLRDTTTIKLDVAEMMREQVNRIVFSHAEGEGALYYTASLHVQQPVEAIKATDRGLSFTRTYYIDGKPVTAANVGDVITVVLEFTASQDMYYVVINDPIPAGTEAIDRSLQTTSQYGERPNLTNIDDFRYYGWGWWYFSDTQLRTEKVTLSASYLPRGNYRYVYQVQATTPGVYRVIPPNGNEFYFPEVFGRGEGSLFTVRGE